MTNPIPQPEQAKEATPRTEKLCEFIASMSVRQRAKEYRKLCIELEQSLTASRAETAKLEQSVSRLRQVADDRGLETAKLREEVERLAIELEGANVEADVQTKIAENYAAHLSTLTRERDEAKDRINAHIGGAKSLSSQLSALKEERDSLKEQFERRGNLLEKHFKDVGETALEYLEQIARERTRRENAEAEWLSLGSKFKDMESRAEQAERDVEVLCAQLKEEECMCKLRTAERDAAPARAEKAEGALEKIVAEMEKKQQADLPSLKGPHHSPLMEHGAQGHEPKSP